MRKLERSSHPLLRSFLIAHVVQSPNIFGDFLAVLKEEENANWVFLLIILSSASIFMLKLASSDIYNG